MSLPWKYWAPRIVVGGLASCSLQLDSGAEAPTEGPVATPSPVTLAFEEPGTLQLVPGDLHTVWVVGRPPAPYEVSFSLLGDAAGAWVDRTTVVADEDGRASVRLHASNLGSTFRLRAATKSGPAAELGVAVSAEGFGALRVLPAYQGSRVAKGWTASVVAGATCEELAKTAPGAPAGALETSGGPDGPVVVHVAPVGPSLAVALHSGRILWGCTIERELQAGATRDVWIPVKDLPVDLAATSLNMKLTIEPSEALDAMLAAAAERMIDGFLPADGEAALLLDAMELATPPEQATSFAARRSEREWDTAAQAHLSALPIPLRDRCHEWARAGLASTPLAIVGLLTGSADTPGRALFEVSWLGSVTADMAGVPPAHVMSWTADPGDVLRFAGTLSWVPSRYVGGAAGIGAAAEMAESVPAALADAADCKALGQLLGGYPGCNSECMAALCADGIKLRWRAGLEASEAAGLAGEIAVTASGPAQLDSAAAPISWTAAWLGTIRDGESPEASVEGLANAVSTELAAN